MGKQEVALVPDYNWQTIPVRESRKGIMQRVFRGNDILIGYSELHPHGGDRVFAGTAGSLARSPPNVVQWAEPPSPEDGVAINMDIWTPYRPDFGQFTAYQTDNFDSVA
jgi:hypothetical protein